MTTPHAANTLSLSQKGFSVAIQGWVHRRRDHGGVIFIDLRDSTGLVQVVIAENNPVFCVADELRSEFVIACEGIISPRPEGTINTELASGEIEVIASKIEIINRALPLPFPLDSHIPVGEETRLAYRFLDLRREEMQKNLRLRAKASSYVRRFLEDEGFLDIETPSLTAATPEGARDFLVPSRLHGGSFYALPQSPQLFKQLLVMGGFERYYQMARCFRDEDLRADRQLEFTQIDIEAAFMDESTIMDIVERMIRGLFETTIKVQLPKFPVITYKEAVSHYGTDRPDLRVPFVLTDLTDLFENTAFAVFQQAATLKKGNVSALKVDGGATLPRSQIDELTKFVSTYGAKGLAYIKINEEGLSSPILKFLSESEQKAILERTGAKNGDIIFFGAGNRKIVLESLGALRLRVAEILGAYDKSEAFRPLWVVDFPLFEENDEGGWTFLHHPFTRAKGGLTAMEDPEALAHCYDLVVNGTEFGGGSLRIYDIESQYRAFEILGFTREAAKTRFHFLFEALQYGAVPHGGLALGFDRIVMHLANASSIREVIAFPKTQSGYCPLTGAPSQMDEANLKVLSITTLPKETN